MWNFPLDPDVFTNADFAAAEITKIPININNGAAIMKMTQQLVIKTTRYLVNKLTQRLLKKVAQRLEMKMLQWLYIRIALLWLVVKMIKQLIATLKQLELNAY